MKKKVFFSLSLIVLILGGLGVLLSFQNKTQAQEKIPVGRLVQTNFDELKSSSFFLLKKPKEKIYISDILETDFEFNGVGIQWSGYLPPNTKVLFKLKYFDGKNWSSWISLENQNDLKEKNDQGEYFTQPIFIGKGEKIQYQIILNPDLKNYPELKKIELIYLDTTRGPSINKNPNLSFLTKFFKKVSAQSDLTIYSREEWGADESLRFDRNNKKIWPEKYQEVQKFIIHHTAGSNGKDDPAAVIRGVYYWHARVLSWGDIGYNYLIDSTGNIYEGRYGGDGVIGAHAYDSNRDADYNPGSLGVGILGNYETEDTPNKLIKRALIKLIAQKARDFQIEPSGQDFFVDQKLPNIIGHRDVDATLCPGQTLYEILPEIRKEAQTQFQKLGGLENKIFKASFVEQSDQNIDLKTKETKEIWIDFKNEGNFPWRNYTSDKITIGLTKSLDYQSPLKTNDWLSNYQIASTIQPNVAPGEIGRFKFTIKAPEDYLTVTEELTLITGKNEQLENTNLKITVNVTGLEYAALLVSHNIYPATFINSTQKVNLEFQNKGTQTWSRGKIFLNIYDLDYRISRYQDPGWPNELGEIRFSQTQVRPGETTIFSFNLKSPSEIGLFRQIFKLNMTKGDIINNEFSLVTRVDSHYQAEFISYNIPLAMLDIWNPLITVKFRNIGIAKWNRSLILNIYDLDKKDSKFRDRGWNTNHGEIILQEREVQPGEVGTFRFRLKPPSTPGVYLQIFELELENRNIPIQNGGFSLLTRVDKYK